MLLSQCVIQLCEDLQREPQISTEPQEGACWKATGQKSPAMTFVQTGTISSTKLQAKNRKFCGAREVKPVSWETICKTH